MLLISVLRRSSNRELFASDNPEVLSNLRQNTVTLADRELSGMMNEVLANLTEYKKGTYILTDDKAPVELLGMQVIDELIKDEVAYYKDIYERDGIKGLIDLF